MRTALIALLLTLTALAATAQESTPPEARLQQLEARVAELEALTEPLRQERAAAARRQQLAATAAARAAQDAEAFTPEQLQAIQALYAAANTNWSAVTAADQAAELQQQYPKANLTGCALLKLAEGAKGDEREFWLQHVIANHGDCIFPDGVQTGAYARFLLAQLLLDSDRADDAEKLQQELAQLFPDAIDPQGRLLSELLAATPTPATPAAEPAPADPPPAR